MLCTPAEECLKWQATSTQLSSSDVASWLLIDNMIEEPYNDSTCHQPLAWQTLRWTSEQYYWYKVTTMMLHLLKTDPPIFASVESMLFAASVCPEYSSPIETRHHLSQHCPSIHLHFRCSSPPHDLGTTLPPQRDDSSPPSVHMRQQRQLSAWLPSY